MSCTEPVVNIHRETLLQVLIGIIILTTKDPKPNKDRTYQRVGMKE